MPVSKKELACQAGRTVGHPYRRCIAVIDAFCATIADTLSRGLTIELRRFATIDAPTRKPKPGRNPRTGRAHPIPERIDARVTFSPELKNEVKALISKDVYKH